MAKYHTTFAFGAGVPLLAGVALFGWRAAAAVGVVVGTAVAATVVWRRVGTRGATLRPAQVLSWAVLLALMLPAALLARFSLTPRATWPVLPTAGLLLVVTCWAAAGRWGGRAHPSVVVYLLLSAAFGSRLSAEYVLQRGHVVGGDVLDAPRPPPPRATPYGWLLRPATPGGAAVRATAVPAALDAFTHGRSAATTAEFLRDKLPPLDDVLLGATPGGIGTTGAVAAVVGGLFLLYRGLIDWRVPLLTVATAWAVLLVLPLRLGGSWAWVPSHVIGWAAGVTFADYQVLGTPLVFTAVFLAPSPAVRPLGRRGRTGYAVLLGLVAATLQVYVSAASGSYLALLLVGCVAPLFDRHLGRTPLA